MGNYFLVYRQALVLACIYIRSIIPCLGLFMMDRKFRIDFRVYLVKSELLFGLTFLFGKLNVVGRVDRVHFSILLFGTGCMNDQLGTAFVYYKDKFISSYEFHENKRLWLSKLESTGRLLRKLLFQMYGIH